MCLFRLAFLFLLDRAFARLGGFENESWVKNDGSENVTLVGANIAQNITMAASTHSDSSGFGMCNPMEEGEIRNAVNLDVGSRQIDTNSRCLDVDGFDGKGNVQTGLCDGRLDQIWVICKNPQQEFGPAVSVTIRNTASQYCLTRSSDGNLVTSGCSLPKASDAQLWYLADKVSSEMWATPSSTLPVQTFRIKQLNRQAGWTFFAAAGCSREGVCKECTPEECANSAGIGNVVTRQTKVERAKEDRWYFDNRGSTKSGRLMNQKTGRCLASSGRRRRLHVVNLDCADDIRQFWNLHESGELINADEPDEVGSNSYKKRCMEAADMWGYVRTATGCRIEKKNRWKQIEIGRDTFALRNLESQECLDMSGGDGNARTGDCQDIPTQRWVWETTAWLPPVGQWLPKGCNNGGPIERTVTIGYVSERTIGGGTKVELGMKIKAGVLFNNVEVAPKVSQSISYGWKSAHSAGESVKWTCDNPKKKLMCMWQWYQEMQKPRQDHITWYAKFQRCTNSSTPPKCPVFSQCTDEECSRCVPML